MSDEEKRPKDEQAKAEGAETEGAKTGSASPKTAGVGASKAPSDSDSGAPEELGDEPDTLDSAETEGHTASAAADEAEDQSTTMESAAAAVALPGDAALAHGVHGHDAHGGHDDHFAHTSPMTLLLGVLSALVILTVLTVAVTAIDLGSQGNFVVAMIIATIKAALVMGYFMHLVWDSKFNVFVFLSSFLFVLLFLSMAVLDGGEYQPDVKAFERDQAAKGG